MCDADCQTRNTNDLLVVVGQRLQGTGKTTLAAQVLTPLVGERNTSFPDERVIAESQFNAWVAEKRLIVVSEIYPGGSGALIKRSKRTLPTTRSMFIKNIANHTRSAVRTFCLQLEFSGAMKIDNRDRRWYIPEVVEHYWGASDAVENKKRFAKFRHWLTFENGLGIIKGWAENFGDYVEGGEHPPIPSAKQK